MLRKVAVFYNPEKQEARKAFFSLVRWLRKNGVEPVTSLTSPRLPEAEFAVVLGGDGTILRIARTLAPLELPILGVNLGTVGFLAEIPFRRLYASMKETLRSGLQTEERLMLQVSIFKGGKKNQPSLKSLALNDCYLHAGSNARIIEIETALNGKYLATYNGDGIIVATPTGSTAYSLAASGPIVSPTLPVILLTPICPHTLAQRPLLVSSDDQLKISIKNCRADQFILVSLDGQENIRIRKGDYILIETAPQKLKLLVQTGRNYYQILRTKFRWGER